MDNEFLLFSEREFGEFVGKSEIWARKLRYAGRSPVVTYIGRRRNIRAATSQIGCKRSASAPAAGPPHNAKTRR